MSVSELACTYAALILHDDGAEISADNILTLTKAANVNVEPYWPGLFAKMFQRKNLEDFLGAVGAAPAVGAATGGGAAPAAGGGGAAPAAEEKEEEKEASESDEDMGMSLFD